MSSWKIWIAINTGWYTWEGLQDNTFHHYFIDCMTKSLVTLGGKTYSSILQKNLPQTLSCALSPDWGTSCNRILTFLLVHQLDRLREWHLKYWKRCYFYNLAKTILQQLMKCVYLVDYWIVCVPWDIRFAGSLWPPVNFTSPVSQPLRVAHSIFKLEPAPLCIAPSTK